VEIHEAAQRILRRHALLIALCVVGGLLLGWWVGTRPAPIYQSSARLVLDAADPKSEAESVALADTARGIATSYSHVHQALGTTDFTRDPIEVSRSVRVRTVGSSNIVELTVSDRDPKAASALANALADEVVATRRRIGRGALPEAVQALDGEIAGLVDQLTAADARLDAANTAIASSRDPQALAAASAAANAFRSRRETIAQQLLTAQSQRVELVATDAERPRASVVDPAETPTAPQPSSLAQDTLLGGVAGLVLGLMLAALLEAMRPTVVGDRAVARALGGPLLGRLRCCPAHVTRAESDPLALRVHWAAAGAGAAVVQLVAVRPTDDLGRLVDTLHADGHPAHADTTGELGGQHAPAAPKEVVAAGAAVSPARRARSRNGRARRPAARSASTKVTDATLPADGRSTDGLELTPFCIRFAYPDTASLLDVGFHNAGFAVVAPAVCRRRQLEPLADLISFSRRPLLGVVTYRRRFLHRSRRAEVADA
jgi:capsular polysaccharide biosynthesis protein